MCVAYVHVCVYMCRSAHTPLHVYMQVCVHVCEYTCGGPGAEPGAWLFELIYSSASPKDLISASVYYTGRHHNSPTETVSSSSFQSQES